jgi:multimeric flavodoxin WrbA
MYLVISASPNSDGLTAACAAAAMAGFADAGAGAKHTDLCKLNIERCKPCGNGWGTCLKEHRCVLEDDLADLQADLALAEGVVLITPVYWGEMAERAKAAFDRIRRCEATRGEESALAGTPVIAVAAAGGSGGGITTCLLSMERLVQHTRGQVADLIGVTQRNRGYMVDAIRAAAKTLAAAHKHV